MGMDNEAEASVYSSSSRAHHGFSFESSDLENGRSSQNQITGLPAPVNEPTSNEAELNALRRKYESLDKVEVDFIVAEFEAHTQDHIRKIRCHLFGLYEARKITLLDPEFMRLTLKKLEAIDLANEEERDSKRMRNGIEVSRKHKYSSIAKPDRPDSHGVISEKKQKRAPSALPTKKAKKINAKKKHSTQLKCSLATWDDEILGEKWNRYSMPHFHKEAAHYIFTGFLEQPVYSLRDDESSEKGFLKRSIVGLKKTLLGSKKLQNSKEQTMPKLSEEASTKRTIHVTSKPSTPSVVTEDKYIEKKKKDEKIKTSTLPVPSKTLDASPAFGNGKTMPTPPVKSVSSKTISEINMPQLVSHDQTKSNEEKMHARAVKSTSSTGSSEINMPLLKSTANEMMQKVPHASTSTTRLQKGTRLPQEKDYETSKSPEKTVPITYFSGHTPALLTPPFSTSQTLTKLSTDEEKIAGNQINHTSSVTHELPTFATDHHSQNSTSQAIRLDEFKSNIALGNTSDRITHSTGTSGHLSKSSDRKESSHSKEKRYVDAPITESKSNSKAPAAPGNTSDPKTHSTGTSDHLSKSSDRKESSHSKEKRFEDVPISESKSNGKAPTAPGNTSDPKTHSTGTSGHLSKSSDKKESSRPKEKRFEDVPKSEYDKTS